jgi:hypothetical protein
MMSGNVKKVFGILCLFGAVYFVFQTILRVTGGTFTTDLTTSILWASFAVLLIAFFFYLVFS